jgi:hypothetical protein
MPASSNQVGKSLFCLAEMVIVQPQEQPANQNAQDQARQVGAGFVENAPKLSIEPILALREKPKFRLRVALLAMNMQLLAPTEVTVRTSPRPRSLF